MRPTHRNPAGISSFDHSEVAQLPEYQRAYEALDNLVHAINATELGIGQARWLTMAGEMAAALGFGDAPPHPDDCPEEDYCSTFPHHVVVERGRVSARYICPGCGMTWPCSMSAVLPALF